MGKDLKGKELGDGLSQKRMEDIVHDLLIDLVEDQNINRKIFQNVENG